MDVGVGMMEDGGVNQKLRSVCVLLTSCVVGLSFFFFFFMLFSQVSRFFSSRPSLVLKGGVGRIQCLSLFLSSFLDRLSSVS